MIENRTPDFKYINSGRLARLADKIAWLEDEFKICRKTGQTERAEFLMCALANNYKSLMYEVRKQGLITIEITKTSVKVTYNRQQHERIETPATDGYSY